MTITKKSFVKEFLVLVLVFAVLLVSMPTFVGAATGPNFTSEPTSLIQVTDYGTGSTNNHTKLERIWIYGDTLYAAVRSSHTMTDMTIGTASHDDLIRFAGKESIYLDGIKLDPNMEPKLSGNPNWPHWTVFKFLTSALVSLGSGQYTITVTGDPGTGHEINNGFIKIALPYTATGSLDLSGTKTLDGRDLQVDEFEFELYAGATATGTPIRTAKNDADGDFSFATLNYDLDDIGSKTYTVVEKSGTLGGVTYDDTEYTVNVIITDNEDGTLNVNVTSENATSLDFTNTYAATGSLDLSGTKTLNGRDLQADEFEFELYEGATANGTPIRTAKNDAGGDFSFSTINYSLSDVGSKTYTVVEKSGTLGGVTYSTSSHTVNVTISDNGDGTLDVDVTSGNNNSLNFTNAYTATGSLDLSGTKTLNGRDLDAAEFEFELYEGDELIETVSNLADGSYSFTTLDYDLSDLEAPVFASMVSDDNGYAAKTYTVKEKAGDLDEITYDDTQYTIVVNLSDNGDGTLEVDVSVDGEEVEGDVDFLDFTNTYTATGSLDLSGTKTLNGRDLDAAEFEFELYEGDELIETVSNLADGSYSFTTLDYDLSDAGTTKTYTVLEKEGTLSDVTYDDTIYTLSVAITDNGDGTLEINVTGAEADELNFTNTYAIPVIEVTTETIPLAEPTIKIETQPLPLAEPTTIKVETQPIPKTGETAPVWPIGFALLALAISINFIVRKANKRNEQTKPISKD